MAKLLVEKQNQEAHSVRATSLEDEEIDMSSVDSRQRLWTSEYYITLILMYIFTLG